MKNKKLIFILIITLLLSVIANTVVYAKFEIKDNEYSDIKIPFQVHRQGALQNKTFTTAGGIQKNLTYSMTKNITADRYVDVYLDENKGEYNFDQSGNMIGYYKETPISNKPLSKDDSNALTMGKAIEIMRNYAASMYGEDMTVYEISEARINNNKDGYDIRFVKKYGPDKYLMGETCSTEILYDGTVKRCFFHKQNDFDEMDESILSGITEEFVKDYVEDQIGEVKYRIDEVYLQNNDGKYRLEIRLFIIRNAGLVDTPELEYSLGQWYYYELG